MIKKALTLLVLPAFVVGLLPWALLYVLLWAYGQILAGLAFWISSAWPITLQGPPAPPPITFGVDL